VEGFGGDLQQLGGLRGNGADRDRQGVVADVAVVFNDHVERDDVTVAQDALQGADAVDHLFVHREAGVGGIAARVQLVAMAGAAGAERGDEIAADLIQVVGRDTGTNLLLQPRQDSRGDGAGFAHPLDRFRIFDRDHQAAAERSPRRRPKVR
jgi:hypothetical protein